MSEDNTQSLSDILNGVEPVEPEPEAEIEETTTAENEQEEPVEVAPAATKEPESEWTKAAVLDERRKRQEMQRENEELKARLAERQEQKKAPDVFEDQEGFSNHISETIRNEVLRNKVEMSQELMREKYDDYDEKEEKFVEMMRENPELQQKMLRSAMPAKFVVETVLKAERLKAMENIDEYESKLRADIESKVRAELEAEYGKKLESEAKTRSIKPSLASARSTVASDEVDTSLKALLNGR